ncbi:MAG: SDR family NAD(P)-dependent oxidoreductase [Mycobacterium sp.]
MTNELAGKIAIVTGRASGLSYATVQKFIAAGAEVVIADLDGQRGEELAAARGDSARFERVDVADSEQMKDLITSNESSHKPSCRLVSPRSFASCGLVDSELIPISLRRRGAVAVSLLTEIAT